MLFGLKGSTKIQKIETLFIYKSRIYNVQSKYYVNCRGMKNGWNKKLYP